ncbi:MAG: FHA domain-containing protein, partial [Myxococcales bacterium]|nr:FHA domain-containing protein [Myxococcales bacterium]
MAHLRFTTDDGQAGEVRIDAQNQIVKIGRANDSDIRTANVTVSRRHCQVVFTGSGFKLYDLNSANGTYVNRNRITEHTLNAGDVFFCGNYEVHFIDDAAAPAVPAPPEIDVAETLPREAPDATEAYFGVSMDDMMAAAPLPGRAAEAAQPAQPAPMAAPAAADAGELARLAEENELLRIQLEQLNAALDEAASAEDREATRAQEAERLVAALQQELAAAAAPAPAGGADPAELERLVQELSEANEEIEVLEQLRTTLGARVEELEVSLAAAGDAGAAEVQLAELKTELEAVDELRRQEAEARAAADADVMAAVNRIEELEASLAATQASLA